MDMGPLGKYQMFDRPHGMIGGMMNKGPEMADVPPSWQIYFRVPEINAAVERITANGGQILKVAPWGRRRLAYPIDRYREGFEAMKSGKSGKS